MVPAAGGYFMKWIFLWSYFSLAGIALLFNLLGLLNLYPLYVTAPTLFFVLFIPVYLINRQKRWK